MKIKIDFTVICLLLTAVFTLLKMNNIIQWSWWWVFSPILIPLGFAFAITIVIVLWAVISNAIEERRTTK